MALYVDDTDTTDVLGRHDTLSSKYKGTPTAPKWPTSMVRLLSMSTARFN